MTPSNHRQVVLARRPQGRPEPEDFSVVESLLRSPQAGDILVRNLYFSMDAGFRHWMNAGSGDDYLPEMGLGEPVMSLILGEVITSNNDAYAVGDLVMGRLAWEEFSIATSEDFLTKLSSPLEFPAEYYLGVLGGTGMTAYFGMKDIGQPQAGETVLISAAAGAVGVIAGQIAALHGARVVGMTSSNAKAEQLIRDYSFDSVVNYREADSLDRAIAQHCPEGIDVYFDNVGGITLNAALKQLNANARVPLCGAISTYSDDATQLPPGPQNLFEMVTKRVRLQGFMYTDQVERYGEAMDALGQWLRSGQLRDAQYQLRGIENAGQAFCDMFAGLNLGKTIVAL